MSVRPITLSEITAEWFSPKIGSHGDVVTDAADVNQAIAIILKTYPGEDVHRPEFGSRVRDYIDHPTNSAIPNIVRETFEAIGRWEPRIEVLTVEANVNIPEPAQAIIRVTWQLIDSSLVQSAEVSL